ncbi:tumor necrosis factor receptor superfamily member 14-like isoform X2 [Notolabrus celidotus]|uniref:tumor necrosis factor receptor superfamily member 14-like isoform X2 n=1 Tax=Notolabrus celidotus TaxID=1203425 RepID=UPI00149047B8|nr:tumor necrosis factor receptor superfamily member 14-like isoform X2 [Notolabrus celidotus]
MFPTKLCSLLVVFMIIIISRGQTLACSETKYQVGNDCCSLCGKGEHLKTECKGDIDTSCKPCADGTYMDELNSLNSCYPCFKCDEGSGVRTNTSCTRTSDTVCEPLEGFFCNRSTEHSCLTAQRHRICKPGQYISQNGTSMTDAVCSNCTNGTFSDGTFPSCRTHTQCESLNKPGNKSADAECGEPGPGKTGWNVVVVVVVVVVVGVVVVVVVVVVLSALVALRYREKIKRSLNSGTKDKDDRSGRERGSEEGTASGRDENLPEERERLNGRPPGEESQDRAEDQLRQQSVSVGMDQTRKCRQFLGYHRV